MRVIRQLIEHLGGRGYLTVEQVDKLCRMGLVEMEADQTDIHEMPIDDLDLTVRAYNCLKREGVQTVGQLVALTETELLDIRNMNDKAVAELKYKLGHFGLSLREHRDRTWTMDDSVADAWDARGETLGKRTRRKGGDRHNAKHDSRLREPRRGE